LSSTMRCIALWKNAQLTILIARQRVTTYKNEEKVSTWDVYLNEDTRYTLKFEAEPNYRNGLWMDLLKTYDENALNEFDRENAVWLGTGSWVLTQNQKIQTMLKHADLSNILKTKTAYSQGLLNEVIKIRE